MPNYWVLKTDPDTYTFEQLEQERRTRWDGVSNAVALKHLRSMATGDRALIYHTGDEKAIVGLARIVSMPYADPKAGDARLVVVDVEAGDRLARPVPLAAIKADPIFQNLGLVRTPRLSVVPLNEAEWKHLLAMGGGVRSRASG